MDGDVERHRERAQQLGVLAYLGKPFDEETLFQIGSAIEQAAGKFEAPAWW